MMPASFHCLRILVKESSGVSRRHLRNSSRAPAPVVFGSTWPCQSSHSPRPTSGTPRWPDPWGGRGNCTIGPDLHTVHLFESIMPARGGRQGNRCKRNSAEVSSRTHCHPHPRTRPSDMNPEAIYHAPTRRWRARSGRRAARLRRTHHAVPTRIYDDRTANEPSARNSTSGAARRRRRKSRLRRAR